MNNDFKVQVSKDHYTTDDYNHGARWMSYFYQLRLIKEAKASNVLEVGPGHGWMSLILKEQGVMVQTVDIDPEIKPDYVASVGSMPIPENSFDVVCAFEVLEHLPFETFSANLREMGRVSKHRVIISLPDHRRTLINMSVKIPFFPNMTLFLKVPSFQRHVFNGQHYWEIGKRRYSPSRVKEAIRESGLTLVKAFVPRDTPMNYYFVMEK